MRKFAIALLATAAALAMVPAAMATDINFNCPGSLNGGQPAPPARPPSP
jgi:hypothetical protein